MVRNQNHEYLRPFAHASKTDKINKFQGYDIMF